MVWSISKLTISTRTTRWPLPPGTKIYLIFTFLFMHSPKIWFVHPLYSGMIPSLFSCVPTGSLLRAHRHPSYGNRCLFIPESVYGVLRLQRLCMLQSTIIIVVRSTGVRSTECNRLRYVHRCMMYTSKGKHWINSGTPYTLHILHIFCILKYELWIEYFPSYSLIDFFFQTLSESISP